MFGVVLGVQLSERGHLVGVIGHGVEFLTYFLSRSLSPDC